MTFGQELVVLHTRPSMFEGFQCMLHITSETFHIGSLKVKLIMACHDVPQITTIVIATMSLHSKIQQTSKHGYEGTGSPQQIVDIFQGLKTIIQVVVYFAIISNSTKKWQGCRILVN